MTTVDRGFGQRLRAARLAAALSQEALAERARLSPDTIAALERGRRRMPRPSTVSALASALGLDGPARLGFIDPEQVFTPSTSAAAGPVTADATGYTPTTEEDEALIGRGSDLDALGLLLAPVGSARLVTLVGPGGVGKTTLARAVARAVRERYPDGVVFVDVAQIVDETLIVPTIGRALPFGPRLHGGTATELARALEPRNVALVLDGAERLTGIGALIDELVERTTALTVVVTSRFPLASRFEHRFAVRPLPVPEPLGRCDCAYLCGCCDPSRIRSNPAVQLFERRARIVAHDFEVHGGNAAEVARLCAKLDGIPLALELAAARISLLDVSSLLLRMDRPLAVLTSSRSSRPDRNRSLRATLDWSYELLDAHAQRLFTSLSIFRGGFDVPAAEAVCAYGDQSAVLDGLQTLTDAGMVAPSRTVTGRVMMLDTLHEYARERLGADGRGAQVAAAHLRYYLSMAEESALALSGPDQAAALRKLDREHDNLRAALTWAERYEYPLALRLTVALWRFWQLHGHLAEGRQHMNAVLDSGLGHIELRAEAGYGAAVLAFVQGDLDDADRRAEQCLAGYREVPSAAGTANALNVLANIARERGAYLRATALYQESLLLSRRTDNLAGVGATLNNLGTIARYQGDLLRARQLHEESLSLRVRLGDTRGVANCLENLAHTAGLAGDRESALNYGLESLSRREQLGDRHGVAITLATLSGLLRNHGDQAGAARYAERALVVGHAVNDVWVVAAALSTMVGLACDRGDWAAAARLAGALSMYRELTGATLRPAEDAAAARSVAEAARWLDAAAYECAWILGRATDIRRDPAGSVSHLISTADAAQSA